MTPIDLHSKSKHLFVLILLCLATAFESKAQTFSTVFAFDGTNGSQPNGPLAQGLDGNLYGTTSNGGSQNLGTVFKVTPTRHLTTLYHFCSQVECADGGVPQSGLVLGTDGNLYGSTTFGGVHNAGTLFRITPQGLLTTLYNFCAQPGCGGGYGTNQALIQGTDGNFYGAAPSGGRNRGGTIFKISPAGKFTLLYSFCSKPDCADGSAPNALVQATDGNFYGTNQFGPGGTVFRLTPSGTLTTLHRFCVQTNCGYFPAAGLTQASDGALYGTTAFSVGSSFGTAFKITLRGAFTTIHRFCTDLDCDDGAFPRGKLIQGTDGNLYGTTTRKRSTANGGTVFQLTRSGSLTVLHTFPGWRSDVPGVIQAMDGNFYGTTTDATANHHGIIFKLGIGLAPFVETAPPAGAVDLSGATAVDVNGAPTR